MRALLVAVVTVAFCACAPAAALAEEPTPIDSWSMAFPAIQDPSGPEEFIWEVQLDEGQDLRQIDDRHAAVYYTEDDVVAFTITAVAAHDSEGKSVPTTLAVTPPNFVTLTVHHRAGNPAAGGAPFAYPISSGSGWEGGFHTYPVEMPPPEITPAVPEIVTCMVPSLFNRSLRAARRVLRGSNCELGPVRGERFKGAKVTKQFRRPGKALPAGTAVGVKLG